MIIFTATNAAVFMILTAAHGEPEVEMPRGFAESIRNHRPRLVPGVRRKVRRFLSPNSDAPRHDLTIQRFNAITDK
jgi:hypothetical protein